jgi:hypothetical protein
VPKEELGKDGTIDGNPLHAEFAKMLGNNNHGFEDKHRNVTDGVMKHAEEGAEVSHNDHKAEAQPQRSSQGHGRR